MEERHSYNYYTEEQFAADEYFQQWVLSNNVNTELFWSKWLQDNQAHAEVILNARKLVLELAAKDYQLQPLTIEEKAILKQDIFSRLDLDNANKPLSKIKSFLWKRWMAAAAILIMLGAGLYLFNRPGVKEKLLLVQTGSNQSKEIQLPDSSVIILNAGSSLQYSNRFDEKPVREVYLKGNAFFKVKKVAYKKKFLVHAGMLNVTVLGTKFNIDARTPATEVVLTSGSVQLGNSKKPDAVALMQPGDKVVLDTLNGAFTTTKINTQLYSAWTEGKWTFSQTSLEEIMKLLKTYYGNDIVFKNEKAKQLKMSAVIPVNSLSMLLPVISKTLVVGIAQKDNQIIIQ